MRIQAHAAAPIRIEIHIVKKSLETADVVHMRVRQIDRLRRFAIARQIGRQRLRPAVDHQQRRAVALDHAAGRSQLRRLRAADTEKAQRETHDTAPRGTLEPDAPAMAA